MDRTVEKRIGPAGLFAEGCTLSNAEFGVYVEVGPRNVFENVVLGDYSYTGQDCVLQNTVVGKFANIAAHVRVGPTNHPMDRPTLHHFTYRCRMYDLSENDDEEFLALRRSCTTRVGHDTWIGHGAIIMPGVRIGDGAVVGSGAVVTKDVEPYTIVVGVPACFIRRRFPAEVAEALQAIAWWDWDHQTIKERLRHFSGSVGDFIARYRRKNE